MAVNHTMILHCTTYPEINGSRKTKYEQALWQRIKRTRSHDGWSEKMMTVASKKASLSIGHKKSVQQKE